MNLSHYPVYTVEHQVTRQSRNQFTEKSSKQGFFHFAFSGGKKKKGENTALQMESFPSLFPLLGEEEGGGREQQICTPLKPRLL